MRSAMVCAIACAALAFPARAQDPAPVTLDALVYATNTAGTKFSPFTAKPGQAFDVVVRLVDGPGGPPILDGRGAPFVETLTVTVSPTAVIDRAAGQLAEAGMVDGRVRLVVGAVTPLPDDLLEHDVWFTTQVLVDKPNGSVVTHAASPPQPSGLRGFTAGQLIAPAGFGQYVLDPMTGLLSGPGPVILQGADGARGPTGPTGSSTGAAGAAGPQGPAGPTGPVGIQGPLGLAGPPGASGPAGPAGIEGPRGPTGKPGDPLAQDPNHDGDFAVDDVRAVATLTGTELAIETIDGVDVTAGGDILSRGSVMAKRRIVTQSQQDMGGEFLPPDALAASSAGDIVADEDLWADGDVFAWNGVLRALQSGMADLPPGFFLTPGDVYASAALVAGDHVLLPGSRLGVGIPDSATNPLAWLDVADREAELEQLVETVAVARSNDMATDDDLLALAATGTSTSPFQMIEASRGADVEFRVDGDGEVFADGAFTSPAADFAEMIAVSTGAGSVEPGDVLVIDPARPRSVARSAGPWSTLVAGVYSTRPGFVGSERPWDVPAEPGSAAAQRGEPVLLSRADMAAAFDEVPLAVVGIVPCKVSAANGPIRPGDLLVTAFEPGHAMRDDQPRPGTIVGKALDSLDAGTGRIRILVKLQ